MTTAGALRAARAEMEKRGFCRYWYSDPSGAVCVLGAMGRISTRRGIVPKWWLSAANTFSLAAKGDADFGASQASDTAKNVAEVLAAFEAAAQIAESAELTDAHWPEPSASPTPPLSSPSVATAPAGSPACPPAVATLGALGGEGGGT